MLIQYKQFPPFTGALQVLRASLSTNGRHFKAKLTSSKPPAILESDVNAGFLRFKG